MRGKGVFHFICACVECLDQIAVAILKVLEDFGQLASSGKRIERQDAIDDVIRARLIGRIEVPRFGRRLKWPDDYSCRIRAQIKTLPIQ